MIGELIRSDTVSLWPVWGIFVQISYACKNSLNGLLCNQNHLELPIPHEILFLEEWGK